MRALIVSSACVALSGCLTQSGNALTRDVVSKLPPLEVRFQPTYTCSQMVDAIKGDDSLSAAQQRTLYRICEEGQKGMVLEPSKAAQAFPAFDGFGVPNF
ncbi:MAG: hypothetical protein WA154_12990 [Moraxellaceae bacterium]